MNQDDFELEADIYRALGQYYLRDRVYDKALENFIECFEISKEHLKQDPSDIYKLLADIGNCEFNLEYYKSSIESFKCAEAIHLKNKEIFSNAQVFPIYKKLGEASAHRKIGQTQEAIKYYEAASDHMTDEILPLERAGLYSSIASCYMSVSDLDKSVENNLKAIEQYTNDHSRKSNLETSRCYFYIGFAKIKVKNNFIQAKNYSSALDNLDKSIEFRVQGQEPLNTEMGVIYSQKGLVLLIVKDYLGAIKFYELALSCFSNSRKKDILEW